MKKYFVYELKKSAFIIGVLALVATAIYLTVILTTRQSEYVQTNIDVIAFLGGALAMCVPVWVFSYRMKKRSVDMYYALPLRRVEILAVKYLIGLIAVVLPFTVAFWSGALATYAKVTEADACGMSAAYYVPYYFSALGGLLCIYSVAAFAFTRANRTIDGIIFIVFWMLALNVLVSLPDRIVEAYNDMYLYSPEQFNVYNDYIFPSYFSPVSPLSTATWYFEMRLESNSFITAVERISTNQSINMGVGLTVTALCAAGANVMLFLGEKYMRAENVGQVSDSPFGYKVMIPLFTVCLIGIARSIPLIALIIVGMYALYAVYRHTLKIGVRQAIVYASSAVVGIIIDIICRFAISI